jgi:hypothetical protein
MFKPLRIIAIALSAWLGTLAVSDAAPVRALSRRPQRPTYASPYFYGYAYGPWLYYENPTDSTRWSRTGSANNPFWYGNSGYQGSQSGFSAEQDSFYFPN